MEKYNFDEFCKVIKETFLPEFPDTTIERDKYEPIFLFVYTKFQDRCYYFKLNEYELIRMRIELLNQIPEVIKEKFTSVLK